MSPSLGAVPPTWWRALLAVGVALLVVEFTVPALEDVAYVAIGLLGVVGLGVGVRLNQPRHAAPWWAFVAGLSLWVVADLLLALGRDGLSDAAFAAGYAPLTLGLVLLARVRTAGRDLAGLLDAVMLALALTVAFLALLGWPVVASGDFSASQTAVELAFVAGDLLLLAGLVRIATSPGGWVLPMRLLAAAIALVVAADALSLALRLYGGVAEPRLPDVLYLLSYLAWGAAALHPGMLVLTERGRPQPMALGRARLGALGLAVVTPTVCRAVQTLTELRATPWTVVLGTFVITGLVLVRLRLAFTEVEAAHDESTALRDQLSHEATHDGLTGLPNRARGLVLVESALNRVFAGGGSVSVLFIDLDGFKQVNDTFGHRAGDVLLQRVAERLRAAMRDGDTAIRLGGDEFVVVVEALPDSDAAMALARRLITTISEPVTLGSLGTAKVGASIGVSQCFDGTTDAVTLLDEADMAAYRAKAGGRGRAELFDPAMRAAAREAESLASDLRRAVVDDRLELRYQPIVDAHTGRVRSWEALVRWNRPGHGLLTPGSFLPVAERSELIRDIDRWVVRAATAQLSRWTTDLGRDDLAVHVNVSDRQLRRDGLVADVADALAASGLAGSRLVLEIDHASALADPRATAHLAEVRELGVRVAFADFEAGFRSLLALPDAPVDLVKIGSDFLHVGTTEHDKLLHLVIQGVRAVGLDVIAEGVERADQLATLRALDCAMVQGYHLARPMTTAKAGAYLQEAALDPFSGLQPRTPG
ncbi:hypothetical protein GCM10009737_26840 [Nocardioides lentus]|uniref:EAL domain-containing protein n=1 Tax=Nocardioides lentus TaxID=338077 RepID=A0ABP5AVQ8_9ACTN